jgi:hypothetical protein
MMRARFLALLALQDVTLRLRAFDFPERCTQYNQHQKREACCSYSENPLRRFHIDTSSINLPLTYQQALRYKTPSAVITKLKQR